MLSSFHKYQKHALIVLAAFLMVAWVIIPAVQDTREGEQPVTKLYGQNIYESEIVGMARRWESLGLGQRLFREWYSLGLGYPNVGAFELHALYITAKHSGIEVSKEVVAKAIKKDPPYMRRAEYIVFDAADAENALSVMNTARQSLLKGAGINALVELAKSNPSLKHNMTSFFTEEGAYYAMAELAEPSADITKPAALPNDLEQMLFALPVGEISPVMKSGKKIYFFRVRQASAGINSLGQLVPDDEAFVHETGKFAVVNSYKDYASLLRAKRSLEFEQVRRSYEEYLTIVKYLEVTMGGSGGKVLVTTDTVEQIEAMSSEQANSRLFTLPVNPFRQAGTPDQKALLKFYDERREIEPNYREGITGYLQPRKIQIEYVELGLDEYFSKNSISDDILIRHYEANRDKFMAADGRTQKSFADARTEIEREFQVQDARKKAEAALKAMASEFFAAKAKAEATKAEDEKLLKEFAEKKNLEYKTSEFFSVEDAYLYAPGLAEHQQFLQIAFDGRTGERSPVLATDEAAYIFRVIGQRAPEAVDFDKLSASYQSRVTADFMTYSASERARTALLTVKTGSSREIIKTIAAENGRVVKAVELATAKELPQPVLRYMTANIKRTPGEIARLIKADDQWYTAVITDINADNEMTIEYFAITPETFVAQPKFTPQEVAERARADYKKEKLAEPDSLNEALLEQARTALRDEWQKKDFPAKYREYFTRKASEIIPRYVQENPVIIEGETQLRMSTSPFFRKDDEFIFSDKSVAEAAFKLEPGKLAVAAGEKSAVVMLLDKTDKRLERNTEFVTVDLDRFDQLAVPVSDEEARKFYEANPGEFTRQAGAVAEYLFVSFDDAAKALEAKVTDAEITAYFEANKETTYIGRAFDDELKAVIRRLVARKKADDGAKAAINEAHKIAVQPANSTFALIPTMTTEAAPLRVGVTPLVSASDTRILAFGNAPGLVKRINEAAVGAVSAPVVTAEGWVVFRVIEKNEAVTPKFEDIAGKVRQSARRSVLAARARAALEDARQYVEKHPGSTLEEALDQPAIAAQLPYPTQAMKTGFVDFEASLSWLNNTSLREAVFDAQPGTFTQTLEAEGKVSIARVIASGENPLVRVHYVEVPASLFSGFFQIDEKEAREYYDAHKEDFKLKPSYELEYVIAERMFIEQSINPTAEEVREAYEQTQELYRLPGQDRPMELAHMMQVVTQAIRTNKAAAEASRLIQSAAQQMKDGKAMSATATENLRHMSEVKYSPKGSGNAYELEMVAGLDKFLASANEGDVSPVLQTRKGPAIVKLVKKIAENIPAFEDARAEVKAAAALNKGLARAKETADAVAAKSTAPSVLALADAANATTVKSLSPQQVFSMETGFVSRFDSRMKPLADKLFNLEQGQLMEQPVSDDRVAYIGYVTAKQNVPSMQAEQEKNDRISRINVSRLLSIFERMNQDIQKK